MSFPVSLRRRGLIAVLAALATLAVIASLFAVMRAPAERLAASGSCPPGFQAAEEEEMGRSLEPALPQYQGGPGEIEAPAGTCVRRKHPESFGELALFNASMAARQAAPFSQVKAGALLNALRQRSAILRSSAAARIPGTSGAWSPVGNGAPLDSAVEGYDETNGLGLHFVEGRISDFAINPKTDVVYAAVANGGVWKSRNFGKKWKSVGNSLPTQIVGSVGYSPARGGTLIVATGDNAFGGTSLSGLGVYRSTNGGKSWKRAKGVPAGALGFRIAVDPTNPKKIYAATGFGLYRSVDGAKTFKNVRLPTLSGKCIGHPYRSNCFLRNMVTDVVVQAPDKFEHKGGKVLAAVGWRAGNAPNSNGKPQAKANGLYSSRRGKPGSFKRLETPGFTPLDQRGRIELGAAHGVDQNHNYVYALVQDAVKFNGGAPGFGNEPNPAGPTPYNTVLDGIYVSSDFGKNWTKMADAAELQEPATGSALIGTAQVASLYAPGVQAWYNEWIKPDPTRQVNGVPTRLTFGLEEVWQNQSTLQPQDSKSQFKVIGRYFGGDTCLFLNSPLPVCPTNQQVDTSSTTHPDQHGAIYVPDGEGGVTFIVGNDGGVYRQVAQEGEEFDNTKWGKGANQGFNTLLPYDARIAKDGTVYAGLQDNGHMKITPEGKQITVFGGDGFYAAVDPLNSNIAYEEYVGAVMAVTIDGGKNWKDIDPLLANPAFGTPFIMDPKDPLHLMVGGRDIRETIYGANTTSPSSSDDAGNGNDWRKVFDLGTRTQPGDAAATSSEHDADNRLSAVALRGKAAYVGYCGFCDVITQGTPFANGLATNVGGSKPPKPLTSDGWHIAKAKGLPNRFISGIEIDTKNPKTVYITEGGYAGRRWGAPGVVGEKPKNLGRGHVFRSTDSGKTFRNISGNLPNVPANYVIRRGRQLIVATDIGVFISNDLKGSRWALLGKGLPRAPVFSLQLKPGNKDMLIVATFGRGVYRYRFP
ncbi:MAG: hypothetical protein QOH26_55 [Actinomycetota bacterium]|nr:hypothetical protein [Actinomycetota bacterium]